MEERHIGRRRWLERPYRKQRHINTQIQKESLVEESNDYWSDNTLNFPPQLRHKTCTVHAVYGILGYSTLYSPQQRCLLSSSSCSLCDSGSSAKELCDPASCRSRWCMEWNWNLLWGYERADREGLQNSHTENHHQSGITHVMFDSFLKHKGTYLC